MKQYAMILSVIFMGSTAFATSQEASCKDKAESFVNPVLRISGFLKDGEAASYGGWEEGNQEGETHHSFEAGTMLHEVATLQSPTGECRLLWYIWNNEGAFEVEKIPVENPLYNCANSAQKALAVWFSNDQIGIRSVNQRKLGENDDSEYHEYLELHQGALQSKPKDLADVVAYKHPAKQSCIISSIWPTGLWEHP